MPLQKAVALSPLRSLSPPKHLRIAEALVGYKGFSCYQFVQEVMKYSYPHAWDDMLLLREEMKTKTPKSYWSDDFIPYTYTQVDLSKAYYWRRLGLQDATEGDLLVYLDQHYDPDPASRDKKCPSGGTHVGIIQKILQRTEKQYSFVLLDASQRGKGRHIKSPDNIPPYTLNQRLSGIVAYSPVTITKEGDSIEAPLYEFGFCGYVYPNKHVHVIRYIPDETAWIKE